MVVIQEGQYHWYDFSTVLKQFYTVKLPMSQMKCQKMSAAAKN